MTSFPALQKFIILLYELWIALFSFLPFSDPTIPPLPIRYHFAKKSHFPPSFFHDKALTKNKMQKHAKKLFRVRASLSGGKNTETLNSPSRVRHILPSSQTTFSVILYLGCSFDAGYEEGGMMKMCEGQQAGRTGKVQECLGACAGCRLSRWWSLDRTAWLS